jgi:hypothetical protein
VLAAKYRWARMAGLLDGNGGNGSA